MTTAVFGPASHEKNALVSRWGRPFSQEERDPGEVGIHSSRGEKHEPSSEEFPSSRGKKALRAWEERALLAGIGGERHEPDALRTETPL